MPATGHVQPSRFTLGGTVSVSGEARGQDTTRRLEPQHAHAALTKIEQIVEYLKVLYR